MNGPAAALERYLRAATRGLWGKKRREVREELHAHLLERARRLRASGLSEAQALERACVEMGSPARAAWGFVEVHSMSKLLLMSTLMLSGTGAWLWFNQRAPLVLWGHSPPCAMNVINQTIPVSAFYMSEFCPSRVPGLTVEALTRQFEAAGFPVQQVLHKSSSGRSHGQLAVTFPDGRVVHVPLILPGQGEGSVPFANSAEVLNELQNTSRTSFRLEGWSQPRLVIAGKSVLLESPQAEAIAYNLYAARAYFLNPPKVADSDKQPAHVDLARANYPQVREGLARHHFQVEAQEGAVLAAFAYSGQGKVILDVAPVHDGQLEVYLPAAPLRVTWVPDFTEGAAQSVYIIPVNTQYDSPQTRIVMPQALRAELLE